MKLSKKEVQHIASLARMRLSEKEVNLYTEQLSSILDYVAQLQEVNVDGVLETAQVNGLTNVTRNDKVVKISEEERKKIIDNFPESEDDLLKTKAVF